jgi:hypothetical protein
MTTTQPSTKTITQAQVVPAKVEYTDSPLFSSFYSNNISFRINPLDFVLIFGEIIDANAEVATVERKARVVLNPAQAKAMAELLMKNVQIYESINGPIAMPNGLTTEGNIK